MKTKLQRWDSNSELGLFVQMAALPLAFLGLLLAFSFSFSHSFEADTKGELSPIAYQNPQVKTANQAPLSDQ